MALLLIFFFIYVPYLEAATFILPNHLAATIGIAHMIQPLIELTEILPQMKDMNVVVGVVQILFLLSEHAVHCIYTEDVLIRTPLGQILGRRRKETYPLGAGKILVCLSSPEFFRTCSKMTSAKHNSTVSVWPTLWRYLKSFFSARLSVL